MLITRNWRTFRFGLYALPAGALALSLPKLLELVGREFVLGPWVAWGMGGLFLLAGVGLMIDGMRRDTIQISETGLQIKARGLSANLSWAEIQAVVIEPNRSTAKNPEPVIVLFPADGVSLSKEMDYPGADERKGFVLMEVKEVVQGENALRAALAQHGGTRFANV